MNEEDLKACRKAYEEFRDKRNVPDWLEELATKEFARTFKTNNEGLDIAIMDSAMIMGFFFAWSIK